MPADSESSPANSHLDNPISKGIDLSRPEFWSTKGTRKYGEDAPHI